MVPPRWDARENRLAYGKSLRDQVPRSDHERWETASSRDPIARLRAAEAGKQPKLIAHKYFRMTECPFAFLRGAAPVMAPDLAAQPSTGYAVQLCGDAHARNLGAFRVEDVMVFDVNDFDETCVGPWEWDLKRLAISFATIGRQEGIDERGCRDVVEALVCAWREEITKLAEIPVVELMRHRIERSDTGEAVQGLLAKAEQQTPMMASEKATKVVDGRRRFAKLRVDDATAQHVLESLGRYAETLSPARRQLFQSYLPYDVAVKVAGLGSLGVRNYVVLCAGNGPEDPLLLQVKQAYPSCFVTCKAARSDEPDEAKRVVAGQLRMQSLSDPLLGWTRIDDLPFIVRTLSEYEAGFDTKRVRRSALEDYARVAGETFGKAHARTADPSIIAGYTGTSDNLDKAIAKAALAGAAQVFADHEKLVAATRSGAVKAEELEAT